MNGVFLPLPSGTADLEAVLSHMSTDRYHAEVIARLRVAVGKAFTVDDINQEWAPSRERCIDVLARRLAPRPRVEHDVTLQTTTTSAVDEDGDYFKHHAIALCSCGAFSGPLVQPSEATDWEADHRRQAYREAVDNGLSHAEAQAEAWPS